jgi:two-component system, cell cycle response regulator
MHQQILLIDDSMPIHPLVTTLLADEPVTIHSAFQGQTGLAMAASLHPDLILLDVEMAGLDGFETCRQLKANPSTAGVPVIFLTGRAQSDEMVRGLNLGAVDYVTKPFKLAELQSRVRAGLRTSRRFRSLEETAMIDPLTRLGNRAMFDERFAAEMSLRTRSGNPLSCIVMDVDHFKNINDTYGHPYGDEVLSQIGKTLTDICRVHDVVCRHGGEEFVVLTPNTPADQAALLAERIRIAVAEIPLSHYGKAITVTCSLGVAEADGSYDRLMLERADQALYLSKKQGRNCVSTTALPPKRLAIPA